jgi:hypothetical protein
VRVGQGSDREWRGEQHDRHPPEQRRKLTQVWGSIHRPKNTPHFP